MAKEEEDNDRPIELPISVSQGSKHAKSANAKRNVILGDNISTGGSCMEHRPRDPRFDPRCSGSNDRRHFIRNYAFLDEVKKSELRELQMALKREPDDEKRAQIKMAISRFRNKMIDQGKQQNKSKSRGKFKRLELAEKFKELKDSGKLTKYLERKRKKLLKRDMKSFG